MRASVEMLSRCPRFVERVAARIIRTADLLCRSGYWPLTSEAMV